MGNGAGKNEVKEIAAGEDGAAEIDFGGGENDEYYAKLEAQATEKAAKSKAAGGLFGAIRKKSDNKPKPAPKVVGLVDSDDEDKPPAPAGNRPVPAPRGNAQDDSRLNDEISDLEKTFSNLGIVGEGVGQHAGGVVASAPPAVGGEDHNEFLMESQYSRHTRFPPGASAGATRHRHSISKAPGRRMSLVAPANAANKLKFSWDQQQNNNLPSGYQDGEDWTYKKTVIDGFDPDKFRQVNKQPSKPGGVGLTRSTSLQGGNPGGGVSAFSLSTDPDHGVGRTADMDVPGAVPTYDRAEQKLIASLEQELGVL